MTWQLSRRGLFWGLTAGGLRSRILPSRFLASGGESASLREGAQVRPREEPPLPPINARALGKRVVDSVKPATGERAILVYDPTYYLELARTVEQELTHAGVAPLLALTFDPPEVVEAFAPNPAAVKKQEEEFVSLLRPVFEKMDLFFWLPARELADDVRFERLLDSSHARGIHFHWILELSGKGAEEIRALSRMYERAILETDAGELSKRQDRLIELLRGQSLRLTTPDGTDLRMRVPREAWFHKNDGDMSPARARQAHCVRDREMEFPAGALRFIPDAASVEGRLVVQRVAIRAETTERVSLQFERGRAVRTRAEKGESLFLAEWKRIGGDIDMVGEIVLGTNPLLVASMPSGELPYFGYGAGYVRVSLGDNWESGGTNRSPSSQPLWLFLERASLDAGGRSLIRDGKLVAEEGEG